MTSGSPRTDRGKPRPPDVAAPRYVRIERRADVQTAACPQDVSLRTRSIVPIAANYSSHEQLRDGRNVEIRAFHREDRDNLLDAVHHTSPASLYRRFFGPKRNFSDKEI